MRTPRRAILASYAGPMPRLVVPMAALPCSRTESISRCKRQDDVRVLADDEVAIVTEEPALLALAELLEQHLGIDDHAVAEHAPLAAPAQDARRDEVGDQLLPVDDERVAGVGAAAVADHHVGELGVEVDDLALAFVAPLGADDDDVAHRPRRPLRPFARCCSLMIRATP